MSDRRSVPLEIEPLVAAIAARAAPKAIWLFGSRARGDHRANSDWDLAVIVDEMASSDLLYPLTYRMLQKSFGVDATIIPAMASDIGMLG